MLIFRMILNSFNYKTRGDSSEKWNKLLFDIDNCHPVLDKKKYQELWREFVRTCNEELPILPIYSNNYHSIYNADLENYDTHALWPWSRAILDARWK